MYNFFFCHVFSTFLLSSCVQRGAAESGGSGYVMELSNCLLAHSAGLIHQKDCLWARFLSKQKHLSLFACVIAALNLQLYFPSYICKGLVYPFWMPINPGQVLAFLLHFGLLLYCTTCKSSSPPCVAWYEKVWIFLQTLIFVCTSEFIEKTNFLE